MRDTTNHDNENRVRVWNRWTTNSSRAGDSAVTRRQVALEKTHSNEYGFVSTNRPKDFEKLGDIVE